jgi:hypothetical protein
MHCAMRSLQLCCSLGALLFQGKYIRSNQFHIQASFGLESYPGFHISLLTSYSQVIFSFIQTASSQFPFSHEKLLYLDFYAFLLYNCIA